MGFPGTWMTQSNSVAYRVIPKCACSTIGQIMYYSDHGEFFDGDVHDATSGIHKWGIEESKQNIIDRMRAQDTYTFTCVRNPYTRILSSFFDKICGIQRNGNYYRGNMVPKLIAQYGIENTGDFDQIKSFRRFLLFARDTIRFRRPMDPDIHWSSTSGHASTLIVNGGRYNKIITTENFKEGMKDVMKNVDAKHQLDIDTMPRFNESEGHGPKRAHPVADYFDDLSIHLVYEIYKRDFDMFGYDWQDPSRKEPVKEIDLDMVHAVLGD
ncbi:sulfotransferase family protein [Paramylibacter ulvae]|nr:sulfotransferase family protein [Amylibacter ulvae]